MLTALRHLLAILVLPVVVTVVVPRWLLSRFDLALPEPTGGALALLGLLGAAAGGRRRR